MRKMSIRLLIVCIAHVLIFEGVCQISVYCQREQTDELITLFFNFLLFLGLLIWAVLPGFKKINNRVLRFAARASVVILLSVAMQAVDYFYSWHLRPNLGLYREPAWVSKHPSFQKQIRERIRDNIWTTSDKSEESQ